MKILLTGASGLVGAAFAHVAAARGHEVVGVTGRFRGELPGLTCRLALDLADQTQTIAAVRETMPDAIVNCAAISETGACETDPAGSEALNVALPSALARTAAELETRLIHVSSEQVFDGRRTIPYRITDTPSPVNRYGRQKVASEESVIGSAGRLAAVVRAPLLMGNSPNGRRAIHERLLADWAAGRTPRLYVDELRQPCTAESLAEVLLALAERSDLHGLFHWAGTEVLSRHAMGTRIRDHFRLDERRAPIVAIARADTPEASVTRPPCLALDLAPLVSELDPRPQTFAEQLATLAVPPPLRDWCAGGR